MVFSGGTHDVDGAGGVVDDFGGGGAEEAIDAAVAVGADDDEVDGVGLGGVADGAPGGADLDLQALDQVGARLGELFELRARHVGEQPADVGGRQRQRLLQQVHGDRHRVKEDQL